MPVTRSSRLVAAPECAVDKDGAAGDNVVTRLQAGDHLDVAVNGFPRVHVAQRERLVRPGDPDASGIVLQDHRLFGTSELGRLPRLRDPHLTEHTGLEIAVTAVDLRPNGNAMGYRIEGRCD